ncbi:unnamed protein product [Boreogadus saida]
MAPLLNPRTTTSPLHQRHRRGTLRPRHRDLGHHDHSRDSRPGNADSTKTDRTQRPFRGDYAQSSWN